MDDSTAPYPVARTMLVGAVFDAWADFDRALAGLDAAEALGRAEDGAGSSFAWTLAHVPSWSIVGSTSAFRGATLTR